LSAVEQLNVKYKAKLKQLLGKQKNEAGSSKTKNVSELPAQNEAEEEARPPTPSVTNVQVQNVSVEIQTELGQSELDKLYNELSVLKTNIDENKAASNVHDEPFPAESMDDKLSQEFIRKTLSDLKLLNKDITECLLNDQLKVSCLKENFSKLENENEALHEEKTRAETRLKDSLKQIDEISSELASQKSRQQIELNEMNAKVSTLEQQNLKYKAKLKQLLTKQKQTTANEKLNVSTGLLSLTNEELRSNCSTPIDHSPMYRVESVSASVQTDENREEPTPIERVFFF